MSEVSTLPAPTVPDEYMPSKWFRERLWSYVFPYDGIDEAGWWLGWCPLHDEGHDPRHATARYNFKLGHFKCMRVPESCHAPKKATTLVNLVKMMEARRG